MTAELNGGYGKSSGTGQMPTTNGKSQVVSQPRQIMMRLLSLFRSRAAADLVAERPISVEVPMEYFAHSRRERAIRALRRESS